MKRKAKRELNDVLNKTRIRDAESTRDFYATIAAHEKESRMRRESFATKTVPCLRRGSKRDYMEWLAGYIATGNNPTHSYDYDFPGDIYVAACDCEVEPLYGSESISIIFPAGIKCLNYPDPSRSFNGVGHNNLYFMDGFTSTGFVPIYSDIKF